MDDGSTNAPHSGSRWEPPVVPSGTPVDPAAGETAALPHAAPPPVPPAPPAAVAAEAPGRPSRRRIGRRGGLTALAAGLLVLAGAGGFAIGQAADGGGGDSGVVQGPGHGDGDGDGFGSRDHDDDDGSSDDGSSDDGDGTT